MEAEDWWNSCVSSNDYIQFLTVGVEGETIIISEINTLSFDRLNVSMLSFSFILYLSEFFLFVFCSGHFLVLHIKFVVYAIGSWSLEVGDCEQIIRRKQDIPTQFNEILILKSISVTQESSHISLS